MIPTPLPPVGGRGVASRKHGGGGVGDGEEGGRRGAGEGEKGRRRDGRQRRRGFNIVILKQHFMVFWEGSDPEGERGERVASQK